MNRNAELSSSFQDSGSGNPGQSRMSVAVIGPNAAHRRTVAKALSGSDARAVREFIDYPAKLTDIQRLMEQQRFDVVMIDVDSDQSYALEVVQKFAALENVMVMVYSKRTNDQALLRSCLEAGARDFLPLPADADAESAPAAAAPEPPRRPAAPPADLSRPSSSSKPDITRTPQPEPSSYRAPAPPREPERRPEAIPSRPTSPVPVAGMQTADPGMMRQAKPAIPPAPAAQVAQPAVKAEPRPQPPAPPVEKQAAPNDFAAWDNAWIRAAQPTAAPEPESRAAAATPAIKKPAGGRLIGNTPAPPAQQQQQKPAARAVAVTREELTAPVFRAAAESSSETQNINWQKWALIGGVPVLVIGILTFFFVHHSSRPETPAAQQMQVVTPEPDPSAEATTQASASTPSSAKPSAVTQPSISKPSPVSGNNTQAQANTPQQQQAKPVSSAMMEAQMAAQSKLAGSFKKPGSGDEAPSAGFMAGAIEAGGSMPGTVFGNNKPNVKVVPGVSAISAGVAEGMLVHRTAPAFPQFARQAHMSGTVVLGATINTSGGIEDLHVISGPEIFRGPAMDAVKSWRYRPYKLNNTPVDVQTTVKVIFSLDH